MNACLQLPTRLVERFAERAAELSLLAEWRV
jgi:hypothetical protein